MRGRVKRKEGSKWLGASEKEEKRSEKGKGRQAPILGKQPDIVTEVDLGDLSSG